MITFNLLTALGSMDIVTINYYSPWGWNTSFLFSVASSIPFSEAQDQGAGLFASLWELCSWHVDGHLLCSPVALPRDVGRGRDLVSSSHKAYWSYWIKAQILWPHLTLITAIKTLSPCTVTLRIRASIGGTHLKENRVISGLVFINF